MSLKIVWKLRERRVKLKADIFDYSMDMKAGFITVSAGAIKIMMAENELAFINSLLGENG